MPPLPARLPTDPPWGDVPLPVPEPILPPMFPGVPDPVRTIDEEAVPPFDTPVALPVKTGRLFTTDAEVTDVVVPLPPEPTGVW